MGGEGKICVQMKRVSCARTVGSGSARFASAHAGALADRCRWCVSSVTSPAVAQNDASLWPNGANPARFSLCSGASPYFCSLSSLLCLPWRLRCAIGRHQTSRRQSWRIMQGWIIRQCRRMAATGTRTTSGRLTKNLATVSAVRRALRCPSCSHRLSLHHWLSQ